MNTQKNVEVTIIGAGPMSLAMAARLTLHNVSFTIIEKGNTVGWNMLNWGHVHLFSSWESTVFKNSLKMLVVL